jgi:hypothetical protein
MPRTLYRRPHPFSTRLGPELSSSPFDTQTRELLHHYTTDLYISLAGNRELSVYRVAIPQLGLAYPFVLSSIIAISALHLATVQPHRKLELQNVAITQVGAALPSFRASMTSPNAETIHAIFAFAGSLVYYMMASPKILHTRPEVDRCRLPSRDDDHPHWFQTIRGLMALLTRHSLELANGPFGPVLGGDPGPDYALDKRDDEQLAKLEGMFSSFSSLSVPLLRPPSTLCSPRSHLLFDEGRKVEICREALKGLRRISSVSHSPTSVRIKTSVHMWPGSVSQDFVELIYERDPRALVLLAHHCVLLKRNDYVWYLRGLGTGLLENIWEALEEEWRPWIQWPIEQPVLEEFTVVNLNRRI